MGRHFPFELRARLGFDAPLLSAVSGGVIDTLRAFYERRRRDHLGPLPPVPIACASGGPLCHRPRLPAEARARDRRGIAMCHPLPSVQRCTFRLFWGVRAR